MNKFTKIAIIMFAVQVVSWGIAWGCLNPEVIQTSWFGLAKETTDNAFAVFGMCFGMSLISTMIVVGSAIHLWISDLYDAAEKLQEKK